MAAAGTQTAIGVNGLFLRGFSGSASPAMPSVAPGRPGSTRRGSCWHVPILGGKEGPRRAEALSSLAPRPKISASEPLTSPGPTLDPGQCDYWWAAAAAHPRRLASSFSSGPLSYPCPRPAKLNDIRKFLRSHFTIPSSPIEKLGGFGWGGFEGLAPRAPL